MACIFYFLKGIKSIARQVHRYDYAQCSGAPNENIVKNHLTIALLNVF